MSARLAKIRTKWPDTRLRALPGVAPDVTPDAIFNSISLADKSQGHKYVAWCLDAWEAGHFLWEDIRAGASSRISDQIMRFDINKGKIADPAMRSLMKYKGPGELDEAMDRVGVPKEISDFDLSGKQQKKMLMAKARLESTHFMTENGIRIDIPLTEFASCILGRNTRWCTAAKNDNMFSSYAENGALFIITLPTGERFQAHIDAEYLDDEYGGEIGTIDLIHQNSVFEIMNENDVSLTKIKDSPIREHQDDITKALASYINETFKIKYDDTLRCVMIRDMTYDIRRKKEKVSMGTPKGIDDLKTTVSQFNEQNFKGVSCSLEKRINDDEKEPSDTIVIRVSDAPEDDAQRLIQYLLKHTNEDYVRHSAIIPDASFLRTALGFIYESAGQWKHYSILRSLDLNASNITDREIQDMTKDLTSKGVFLNGHGSHIPSMLWRVKDHHTKALLNGINDGLKELGLNQESATYPYPLMRSMCAKLYAKNESLDEIIPFIFNDKNKNINNVGYTEFKEVVDTFIVAVQRMDYNDVGKDKLIEPVNNIFDRLLKATSTEIDDIFKDDEHLKQEDEKTKRVAYNLKLANILGSIHFFHQEPITKKVLEVVQPDLGSILRSCMEPGNIQIKNLFQEGNIANIVVDSIPPDVLSPKEKIILGIMADNSMEELGIMNTYEASYEQIFSHAILTPRQIFQIFLSQNLPMTPEIQDAIKDFDNEILKGPQTQDIIINGLQEKKKDCEEILDIIRELSVHNPKSQTVKNSHYKGSHIVLFLQTVSEKIQSMEISRKMTQSRAMKSGDHCPT